MLTAAVFISGSTLSNKGQKKRTILLLLAQFADEDAQHFANVAAAAVKKASHSNARPKFF